MNTKELLKQCQNWHEQDEYQKIIDALEEIPEEKRTCEIDMELARAYNNRAVSEEPINRAMLKQSIALMEPYCDELEEDHSWNFRMGYAYFYLEQEGQARWYFEDALKYHPGDGPRYTRREQIQELIEICEARLALPDFRENFRQRTVRAWETFAAREADLCRLLNEEKIEEVLTICRETLHIAFENIAFEIGVGGKKPELILTPEEDRVKLFELLYFRRHAPSEVLEHWEIRLGRQPVTNVALHSDDVTVSADDVRVWVEEYKEGTVALTLYSEKFLPLLRDDEDNEDRVLWLAGALVGNVVGEIPYMRYIAYLHVKGEPDNTPSVALTELPEKFKELGYDLSISAEELLEMYTGYQAEPNDDPDAIWRADVIAGSSSCWPIVEEYLYNGNEYIDDLHADGAVAGFLIYALDSFDGEDREKKIFDFREELEAYLEQNAGADAVTLTGGATGISFGYLDFIAWDLRAVLSAAKEFFENSELTFAGFHVFRQGPDYVTLIDRDENGEVEPLANIVDEVKCIPVDPVSEDIVYQQIEKWNDEDEFTRCITTLETLPEELRDYRASFLLARALENYAIIGDHENEPPREEAVKALNRAIDVLESVREEGKDKAEWNMRMAYAYQYLPEQEEKAIRYAERWAELDPDDDNANAVIEECRAEIEKRKVRENASFYVTLNLNARLQPMHRFELEDELDARLNNRGLGFVDGGGTFTKESGEVSACDIHIALTDGNAIDELAAIVEEMGVPKGSELVWNDGGRAVGSLEGLALSLDGKGLPAEVYQNNDINEVIEKINGLLGEMLVYFSWWEGPKNTVLYYYGESYEKMLAAIADFIGEHPLCQNCVVEQIAGEQNVSHDERRNGGMFVGFDFSDFWDDDEYALKEYVCAPPSDELIAEVEAELGYKLPVSYIWLMKQHNGGVPVNTCFPTDTPTSWAEDHVAIEGIFGIGKEKELSLCGKCGSRFMIDEWGYPDIGVAICDCPSAGHDIIFLDYRECGPQGEPKVVHIDQECDYEITPLADSFEDFIRGLVNEEEFDEYDD